MRDLENCRQEIDEIDAELVRLFERRMGVCRDVALYKQAHYMDILNAAREEAVLKSRAQQAGNPALAQSVMALFTEIMRLSREEQRRYLEEQTETKRIAYSGVPGAYSECAVVGFFGDDCERVNFKTFEEVFAAVADGKARYGVVTQAGCSPRNFGHWAKPCSWLKTCVISSTFAPGTPSRQCSTRTSCSPTMWQAYLPSRS